MLAPIPDLADYGLSPERGFLPGEPPLELLQDPYYAKWEAVVANLQALLLSKRLRQVIDDLPVLSTSNLITLEEWRRAYLVLSFMLHGYIWGGDKPAQVIPPSITIPLFKVCEYLELPPVATYSALVLWNHKPIFPDESADKFENLSINNTFTGSLDEQWFYLVSVVIEARSAVTLPLMLDAISAAREDDSRQVTECLRKFAEVLDEQGTILQRMYDNCDPQVFYNRIRPFLAGSKDMGDGSLANGVLFDDGSEKGVRGCYGGGSNAQSSVIQFFDIVLGVEHRPTGVTRNESSGSSSEEGTAPKSRHNFLHEMRSYMPGPHRRFLEDVAAVANIREYVENRPSNRALCVAYDACLAMLRALRDKHIQMVTRYIIIKSREAKKASATKDAPVSQPAPPPSAAPSEPIPSRPDNKARRGNNKLRGTGGTALLPFLKQARDETGEPAIYPWARRLLSNGPADSKTASLGKVDEHADGHIEVVGLAGTWDMDESEGGLCHW
ncbi:hypothetical protein FQN54_006802 [Arachnomyces sp. PD_36]|nr:hypothetical protein FQN54_006802 [Arachnomyces sp. PD_36]